MASGGTFLEGATVRITATFKVSGTATDPTTVTLKTKDPAGTTSTYTYALSQVTKSSTGVYYKDVALSTVGTWYYRWIGTGSAAGVAEEVVYVNASNID